MKKRFSLRIAGILTTILLLLGNLQAQSLQHQFQNNSSKTGFTLESSRNSNAIIRHTIPQMSLETLETEQVSGQVISINGIYLPNNAGAPNLPGSSCYIAVPEGAKARLEVIDYQKEVIENVDLLPAAPIQLDTDDSPADYSKDMNIYNKDGLYPAEPFLLSEPEEIRGVDVVMLGITPFQYNPVQKQLIVYHNIQVEVVFEDGNGQFGESRLRSRWWDPILKDMLINYEQLPEINYSETGSSNRETGAEYLIVIPDNEDFISWADSIRLFRVHQGISTMIVDVNDIGGNTVAAFENYFNEAYNTWDIPPSAVLMLGDYNTNGTQGLISHMLYDHPGGYNPYISDNPFSDVSGNMLPDIVFARITANNSAQLELMINKFLDYERNPPVNQGFYDNPITAMGWQTERWFQLCSEIVNGFWEHGLGKSPIRENAIYSGSPGGVWSSNTNTTQVVNYFGPFGLNYIPANTSHLTDWGGNASRINNDINNGAFMLQHRDHGYEGGWGEPDYGNSDINGLTNDDLSFIWSVNCLTGKFDYGSESFAEKFHRHPYGAVGIVAATEVSYSFVNDVYVWGAFDNMWPQFMPDYGSNPPTRAIFPAFANAAGKIFLQQSSWPYNPEHKPITYNLFHHHGDAFLNVYSEMPQDLTVNHMPVLLSGLDLFEVTVEEGAWIALTVGDEIIGTAEAVDGITQVPISIQEPNTQIRITITKQNYFRYDQVIECIPPEGSYVILNENLIHDVAGNQNGQIDFGEEILLDIALKNVGSENATEVYATLSTVSPFVTVTQNEAAFGEIPAGEIMLLDEVFAFIVADSIANNLKIPFDITMNSEDKSWTSSFSLTANAPEFSIGNFIVDDTQGNSNGRLDPGETAYMHFHLENIGHSDANATTVLLNMMNPFIEVLSDNVEFENVTAQSVTEAVFEVYVNPASPVGVAADFLLKIESDPYLAEKSFATKVGLIVEDFESGDFESFGWIFSGNQPWVLTENNAYEGSYAAKSGTIDHNQNSQIMVAYEAGSSDTVSFYYKVSSEADYDKLKFYIDGEKRGEWSGEIPWTRTSFPVDEGIHQFRWEYSKDSYVSNGQDCAWIDFVALPPEISTVAWAGYDTETCETDPVQLEGYAAHYESFSWNTTGDGSFDDANSINPVYTPGQTDLENGSVALSLIAIGEDETVADELLLIIHRAPQLINFAEEAAICAGENYIFTDGEALYYENLLWTSNGDGAFEDETAILPVYIPGDNDIAIGTVNLNLEATSTGSCEGTNTNFDLIIHALPTAHISGDQTICEGEEAIVTLTLSGQSPWMVMFEGFIDPTDVESETYEMTLTPSEPVSMTLTHVSDGNGCLNTAEGSVTIEMDYPPESPATPEGATSLDLYETTSSDYSIAEVAEAETYNWSLAPEEAGIVTSDLNQASIDWNTDYRGEATLSAQAINYCGESDWSENLMIELFSTIGLNEFANGQLKVYPNPASTLLYLEINKPNEKAIVSITNLLGKEIWKEECTTHEHKTIQIPVSKLQNGVYILRYESNNEISNTPILIKK